MIKSKSLWGDFLKTTEQEVEEFCLKTDIKIISVIPIRYEFTGGGLIPDTMILKEALIIYEE